MILITESSGEIFSQFMQQDGGHYNPVIRHGFPVQTRKYSQYLLRSTLIS